MDTPFPYGVEHELPGSSPALNICWWHARVNLCTKMFSGGQWSIKSSQAKSDRKVQTGGQNGALLGKIEVRKETRA